MHDVYVYGFIGDSWYGDSVTASQFISSINEAGGQPVTIHVNSGGGDVFDAAAMIDAIRQYKNRTGAKVTTSIEGLAASAASYFALNADEVVMNESAFLMIHNPSSYRRGTASDMRKCADLLDKVTESIVSVYESKTGMGAEDLRRLMDEETWFDASDALEAGFVDSVSSDEPVTACINQSALSMFSHAPERLVNSLAGERGATIATDDAAKGPVDGGEAPRRLVCVKGLFLSE